MCNDETVTLDPGNTAADATCVWSDGSTESTLNVSQSGTYTVECTNNCGTAEATANVTKFFSPTASFWTFDTLICAGTEILIDPTWDNLNQDVLWTMSYTDSLNNPVTDVLDETGESLIFGTEDFPINAQSNTVTITYSSGNICGTTSQELLAYSDACFISATNVLSPDSDGGDGLYNGGLNEGWYIYGIDGVPGVSVKIYDRWGALVYENDNYSNTDPWRGNHKNGNALADGVYFYNVNTPLGDRELSGSVTILRTK